MHDRDAIGQFVLPGPGIGPAGGNADGHVLENRERLPGRGQLYVHQPLQPLVKFDAACVLGLKAGNARRFGTAHIRQANATNRRPAFRPACKTWRIAAAVRQFAAKGVERPIALEPLPDFVERLLLEGKYLVAANA